MRSRWSEANNSGVTSFGYFSPRNKPYHLSAILLSEAPEWDVAEGGGFSSLVSSRVSTV
jgi:hypothetical protein